MNQQELELERYILKGYIANIEGFIQQYRNVVEQAGSFKTLDGGEILLPQIQENLNTLLQNHAKCVKTEAKNQQK